MLADVAVACYEMWYSKSLKLWVKKEKEKVMAYFRADIYHHVPGRNDVRHDEFPSNTQTPERDLQPGPPKNTTKRDKHRAGERRVPAKVFKIFNLNHAMNIQFRSYHWKYYTEFDLKSVLFGYRNLSSDNEQCVNCLSARRIQYDCEIFN